VLVCNVRACIERLANALKTRVQIKGNSRKREEEISEMSCKSKKV